VNELISGIKELLTRVAKAWVALRLDDRLLELTKKQAEMQADDFWLDRQKAEKYSRDIAKEEQAIFSWKSVKENLEDLLVLAEDDKEDQDVNLRTEIERSFSELRQQFEAMEMQLLLSGPYDDKPAILTIYAGAGGVDAQDWAEMLERMYLRYAEKQNWKTKILDRTVGNEAGIKNVTMEISGNLAYGYLRADSGVHRLVRLSPYDADHARHTSFAMVEVLPELEELKEVAIDDNDLRIDVFRAGGHGGQSVNTTDSAVRFTHLPTGITAICQNERSQLQNKEQARKILLGKLQKYYAAEKEEERQLLRGEFTEAAWGNQIRSYVLHPYKMVKDHRTKFESKDPEAILNGDVLPFAEQWLAQSAGYKL